MVFQDPYGSLNPRQRVGSIIGDPFEIHGLASGASAIAARAGADGAGRAQPGALQPLPARVLGRAAPAHRDRPRASRSTRAHRLRRAGLGARRLHPRADPQPAGRPAGGAGAHLPVHLPRPVGGAPRQRPRRRDVPRQGGRDRARGRAVPTARHPYTAALLSAVPVPDRRRAGAPEASSSTATRPRRWTRPRGCRFHPRCPKAQPLCALESSALVPRQGDAPRTSPRATSRWRTGKRGAGRRSCDDWSSRPPERPLAAAGPGSWSSSACAATARRSRPPSSLAAIVLIALSPPRSRR